jgi:hypothetical protein
MKPGFRGWVGALLLIVFGMADSRAAPPASTHSAVPVDVEIPVAPAPVAVDGRPHLYYELHITNFSSRAFELSQLEVLADDAAPVLASFKGAALAQRLLQVGAAADAPASAQLGAGARVVVFLDVPLEPGARVPRALRHRIHFALKLPDGSTREKDLEGAAVAVRLAASRVLQPPLASAGWVATDLMDSRPDTHWRTFLAVDGKERIAQRFATDWVRLGPDGRLFHDAAADNRNWYGYGAEVLAVADAVVSDLHDGQVENVPTQDRAVPVTLDTIAGNYLMLDLGDGRYALYAHLQPGSLRVKLGDKVRAGQVLALLGNSGNSDAPHLHFHVVDGNSPLAAEGVPYAFDRFTVRTVIPRERLDDPVFFKGEVVWQPGGQTGVARRDELPVNNELLDFP